MKGRPTYLYIRIYEKRLTLAASLKTTGIARIYSNGQQS